MYTNIHANRRQLPKVKFKKSYKKNLKKVRILKTNSLDQIKTE